MSCSSSYYGLQLADLAYLRIPLEEIVSATDNFSDANLIGYDDFGKLYEGRLLRSAQWVYIIARRLNYAQGHKNKMFWRDVLMLCRLEHQNIVSIIGFCDTNGEMIVIHKMESSRGCLYYYLRDPTLTWMQRLKICVGVGKALSYIYYDEGRDFSVIHRDIRSANILLDDQWEAKIYTFTLSMTQGAAERNCPGQALDDDIWGTFGYIDPTFDDTGLVSHKSDMFSFGVVLFELLCGKGTTERVREDEMYLYQLTKSHFEGGSLDDLVHPGLRKQMRPESFKIISKTAYACLNAQPTERPSIDQVLIQLEKALQSQCEYEEILKLTNDLYKSQGTQFARLKFPDSKIPLEEIIYATDNFSDAKLIGGDEFGKEYMLAYVCVAAVKPDAHDTKLEVGDQAVSPSPKLETNAHQALLCGEGLTDTYSRTRLVLTRLFTGYASPLHVKVVPADELLLEYLAQHYSA